MVDQALEVTRDARRQGAIAKHEARADVCSTIVMVNCRTQGPLMQEDRLMWTMRGLRMGEAVAMADLTPSFLPLFLTILRG